MAIDDFSIPAHIRESIRQDGYTVNTSMESHINKWWKWLTTKHSFYKVSYQTPEGYNDSRTRLSIRPAKRVCSEWASLLLNEDTTISVEEPRANEWLQDYLWKNNFWPMGQAIIEKAFGMGTAAWALWFDVKEELTKIIIRRYDARMIIPLSWDEEGITECAFVTRASIKGKMADQLQMHILEEGEDGKVTYHIKTKIFINEKEVPAEQVRCIPLFDTKTTNKTFGIIKPAGENTCVDLSPYGMSVFEDAIDAVKTVDQSYDAIFQEVELTEITVFMSDRMLDVKNSAGKKIVYPKGPKSRIIRKIIGESGKDLMETYAPDIRIDPLNKALNIALAELGDLTGFGEQYFKFEKSAGLKTATEVSSDNSALMRNIKRHENILRTSIQDIITSLLDCALIHCGADIEEDFGNVKVQFDDSIIVDTQAEKAQMIAEINAGLLPAWKYAVEFYGMTEVDAKKALPQVVVEEGM